MSWQDVTRSPLCSGVKKCGTKRAHNFLFLKSSSRIRKNYSLVNVQRFFYHYWCDSTVIFEQINNSSNVNRSLIRFWTATSPVIFCQLPFVSKSKISPKNIWSVQSPIPIGFCTNASVSVVDRPALKQNFMANLCSLPPSMTYKENWLYKTSYNSYIVEDNKWNSVFERMLSDST